VRIQYTLARSTGFPLPSLRAALALAALLLLTVSPPAAGENWQAWRGPRGDGTSKENDLPVSWNGKTGTNIAWKIPLPGTGHASPITWGDRIFTISTLEKSGERILLCLNRKDGSIRWQRKIFKAPLETIHRLNSRASSTPATDGKLVFSTFLKVDGRTVPAPNVGSPRPITPGTILVVAHDLDGNQKWKVEAGEFISAHGFNTCPVLYEDLVIINGDHDGDAYIVALEKETGKERWRIARENKTRSYVTPIIRKIGDRTQMVLSGSKSVASYNPANGKRHWIIDGPTEQFVASMVYDGRFLFITGGFPARHILAIRPDGSGNVTDTHIAWRTNRGAAYVPSPIVAGPYFLIVSDNGIASCFEAENGKRLWMERLGGGHSASTVSAGGLVYFVSDKGVTTVVRPGKKFEVVAKNELGERCSASPAISGGTIYIRGHKNLFAIKASGK
jgi:outer membrane protein assembly factor BamB